MNPPTQQLGELDPVGRDRRRGRAPQSKVLVSHPTGNTFVRALLHGLHAENSLGLFTTALGFAGAPPISRFLPAGLRAELKRRSYALPETDIRSKWWPEVARLLSQRLGLFTPIRHEIGWASVDAVYQDLDRHVAAQLPRWREQVHLTAAYAYEDAALHTLRAARQEGLTAVYDLPIAYWQTSRRLLDEQACRLPQWERTLIGTRDSEAKLERKTKEILAADIVICPSKFVRDSLPADILRSKQCVIAEFGTPESSQDWNADRQFTGEKLRVLFAGSMSQRKGLADLFAAMKLLSRSDVELVVLGSPVVEMEFYRSEYPDFIYEAPRPHGRVLELMSTCHLFCLPSIVEGRALVQQEAMSRGLPLIVTPNAGAEDLITEETGFLIPPGRPDLICERIAWCADHRQEVRAMGEAARLKSAGLTWKRYADIIIESLNES